MQYLTVVPFLDRRGRMMYLVGGTVCCLTLEEAHAFARGDVKPDYTRGQDFGVLHTNAVYAHLDKLNDLSAPNGRGNLDRFPWEVAA